MCGRFTLRSEPSAWAQEFLPGLSPDDWPPFTARYNIAPTQQIITILREDTGADRSVKRMRWGLVPSWADDLAIGSRMINARGETIAEKPSFRSAFKQRRCLVPADGYYEWQATKEGKQPYLFERTDERPFAFAGLFEINKKLGQDETPLITCCLITTNANQFTSAVHDRMPVILDPSDWDSWLDPANRDTAALQNLIRPAPEDWLKTRPVSKYVNSAKNEGAGCLGSPE